MALKSYHRYDDAAKNESHSDGDVDGRMIQMVTQKSTRSTTRVNKATVGNARVYQRIDCTR